MVVVTRQARHQACHEITRKDALLQLADRLVAAKEPDLENQAEDQATKQALETWENELRDWLNDDLAKYVEDHGVMQRGYGFNGMYDLADVSVVVPVKFPEDRMAKFSAIRNVRSIMSRRGLSVRIDDAGYVILRDDGLLEVEVEGMGYRPGFDAFFGIKDRTHSESLVAAARKAIERNKREDGYNAAMKRAEIVAHEVRTYLTTSDLDTLLRDVESNIRDVYDWGLTFKVPGTEHEDELVLQLAAGILDNDEELRPVTDFSARNGTLQGWILVDDS